MSDDRIRLSEVRAAVAAALDAFEAECGSEVAFARDYYWHVPVSAAFDLSKEPRDFTVGQVSEDLEEMRESSSRSDAGPAWHALMHTIGILRSLEEAASPWRAQ